MEFLTTIDSNRNAYSIGQQLQEIEHQLIQDTTIIHRLHKRIANDLIAISEL